MPNCFFSCRKRKKGEQRLRRLKLSQMANSNMKGKGEPKRPFGDHFRAPKTEEVRWYHFKHWTRNESLESHFLGSLGIKDKSCSLARLSIFYRAELQILASEPGPSLLEGTTHHRFLFYRNRLQRFVAFQTAAGGGQRHRLGPELLATAPRLAVRPSQSGQHRSQGSPFEQTPFPSGRTVGARSWLLLRKFGGRGDGLKERRE